MLLISGSSTQTPASTSAVFSHSLCLCVPSIYQSTIYYLSVYHLYVFYLSIDLSICLASLLHKTHAFLPLKFTDQSLLRYLPPLRNCKAGLVCVVFPTVLWGLAEEVACVSDEQICVQWGNDSLWAQLVTRLFIPWDNSTTVTNLLSDSHRAHDYPHSIPKQVLRYLQHGDAHISISRVPSQVLASHSGNAHQFAWWYYVKYFKFALF